MDHELKKELKDIIRREIEDSEAKILLLEEQVTPVAPDDAIGRLTRMEAISARGVSEAALRKARLRLEQLRNVLAALDTDPYFGTCLDCGEDIPAGRLRVLPESRLCVACAGRRE